MLRSCNGLYGPPGVLASGYFACQRAFFDRPLYACCPLLGCPRRFAQRQGRLRAKPALLPPLGGRRKGTWEAAVMIGFVRCCRSAVTRRMLVRQGLRCARSACFPDGSSILPISMIVALRSLNVTCEMRYLYFFRQDGFSRKSHCFNGRKASFGNQSSAGTLPYRCCLTIPRQKKEAG